MLVFSFYKGLSLVMAFLNSGTIPDYESNKILYPIVLKSLALLLQVLLVNIPLAQIVRTIYKKNSRIFQDLLTAVCVSGCV